MVLLSINFGNGLWVVGQNIDNHVKVLLVEARHNECNAFY